MDNKEQENEEPKRRIAWKNKGPNSREVISIDGVELSVEFLRQMFVEALPKERAQIIVLRISREPGEQPILEIEHVRTPADLPAPTRIISPYRN